MMKYIFKGDEESIEKRCEFTIGKKYIASPHMVNGEIRFYLSGDDLSSPRIFSSYQFLKNFIKVDDNRNNIIDQILN